MQHESCILFLFNYETWNECRVVSVNTRVSYSGDTVFEFWLRGGPLDKNISYSRLMYSLLKYVVVD